MGVIAWILEPEALEGNLRRNFGLGGYMHGLSTHLWNRSFFTTEHSDIGLASKAARPGAVVCVLLGCDVPLVIRRLEASSTVHLIVGECYIDSFMDGEALLGPLPTDYKKVWKYIEESFGISPTYRDERTSESSRDDPRWELVLGKDYEERHPREDMSMEDWDALFVSEVMRIRKEETT